MALAANRKANDFVVEVLLRDPGRPLHVALQHGLDAGADLGVARHDGRLEVEPERAVVEVGRAHDGEVVVDEGHLLVHEARLVEEHLDAGALDLREIRVRHPLEEHAVARPRHDHPDVDAAEGRQLERAEDAAVGHEVRRGDPDALLRALDGVRVEQAARLELVGRAGGEDERRPVGLGRLGRPLEAVELLAGPVEPVAGERQLEALHDRPLDAEVRVAPVREGLGVPEVLVAHVVAAHEPDAAVHDRDLAVVAEVEAELLEPVPRAR